MSAIKEKADELAAALRDVEGARYYGEPGATIERPGTVMTAPGLRWENFCDGPSSATFLIYVVARADERALELLWDLTPRVALALDGVDNASVTRAEPGVYSSGGSDLPAYEITCEVDL